MCSCRRKEAIVAKYERIANELRAEINSGRPGPGKRLSAETDLAARFDVSVPTMRQALGVLKTEGLIESRHGTGTFVRAARQPVRRTPERYQWEKDRVRLPDAERAGVGATEKDTGLEMVDLDFSAEYHPTTADERLAEVFGIASGTKLLQRLYRTRSRNESAPISLVTSYLLYDVAKQNPKLLDAANEPWPGGTQHQLWTVGIELDAIRDEIAARPPRVDEAEALGIDKEGVAVFELTKTSVDVTGRVVEVSYVVLPGDRTVFDNTTHLQRWEES
jgi:GntR family transcriptional regulator